MAEISNRTSTSKALSATKEGDTSNTNHEFLTNANDGDGNKALMSKPLLRLKVLNILRHENVFQQLVDLIKQQKAQITKKQESLQPDQEKTTANTDNKEEDTESLDEDESSSSDAFDVLHLLLHYAVQVSPLQMIKDIVNNFVINENNKLLKLDINYQDADGNTALHLAAYQSRSDVVQFLMSQTPYINDCVLNNRHLQPIEMCKDMNTASIMQNLRAKYITEIATEFRLAFNNRDFGHLETILENPRNFELLDINGTDPTTGDTVLHEFVKKKDIVMVRWILNHGGDPFKRDKNGKLPIDLVNYNKMSTNQTSTSEAPSKSTTSSDIPRSSATNVALNQELKKVLQQAARDQSVIDITNNLHEPPTFKGYLRKWTNFAQGYKLRWFVLDSEGTLSYYKDQDDTSNACRGSLNMSNCYLHLDSSEKLKFEIVGGSAGSIRWHLKGNHPVETNRWVWAIQGAIRYAKDRDMALKQGPSNKTTSTQSTTAQPNSNNASGLQKQQQRVLSNTSAMHSAGAKQASPNASFTPLSKATTTTAAAGPASYKLSVGTASAAASGSNANDGNGHSKGSSVATSPQNNANEFYKSHRRTNTQNSIQSGLNENLTEDGKQYVEKLKSLDDDGRRSVISQESLSTSGALSQMHLSNKQKNRLPSINFSESAANSSDEGEDEDKDYDDDEEEGDDALETRILEENFYSDNGKHNSKFFTNVGPYAAKISMLERSIAIELTSLNDLFVAGGFEHDESVVDAAQKSLKTMSESFKHLRRIQVKRDKKLIKMLLKQKEINNLWIKSVKDLEIELMQKQDKLGALAGEKKKLVKLLHKSKTDASCNDKMKEEIMQWQKNSIDDSDEDDDEFFDAEDVQSAPEEESEEELDHQPAAAAAAAAASADANVTANGEAQDDTKVDYGSKVESEKTTLRETPSTLEQRSTMTSTLANNTSATDKTKAPENEKASTKISEKSTVAAPKLDVPVPSFVATPKLTNPPQTKKFEQLIGEGTFAGYEDGIRKKLSLSKDDRPSVSLWSVLKSMVGKDMTKMTLPVSFNEPTSLLQRVAEDMEYDNLLEKAANASQDSTLRLLYVSVFAASAYASTQLRVAKPFNPLLGETFEYARPDRDYRFFTEQVSHHPPISAVWCESPKYDYYGESNVDSKFNGRSFDFKHLGLWYVKLRPDGEQSKKDETYTFHKPNNQVVGILIGNPQVDNYGDMEIKNHTTGDRCVLHFKARGWRSNHAYEVKGEVYNAKGGKEWVLGGHWNDDLYAKKVLQPNSNEEIKIDDKKSSSSSTSASEGADAKYDGSKFLIWKAAPRPDSPFNLTSFAITLNAPQPQLVPYLPRTDTRLRPDQRAMEDGKYDLAGDEKHRVEEKQRAVRKKREAGNIKYKPKWFVKKVHPVTKAQYWEFTGDYWKRRENHDLGDCPDIF
ncbi:hypothetical protein ACO0QE_000215 [Hanseniaspora vineae]